MSNLTVNKLNYLFDSNVAGKFAIQTILPRSRTFLKSYYLMFVGVFSEYISDFVG
jgi:hypothetical protein